MLIRITWFILLLTMTCFGQVSEQRLTLLAKGINIPHWYWKRHPHALIDHYMNEEDILALKRLDFRHVRIPFEMADLDVTCIIEQLKKDVKRFTDHQIGVIISAFGQLYNQDSIATPLAEKSLERLCFALKDTSPDLVFIQIANEPSPDDPKAWSSIQDRLIQTARKILPNHTFITSTPLKFDKGSDDWSMLKAFQAMTPSSDENIVYAFHFYEPYLFTHQSADWDSNTQWIQFLAYPTTQTNMEEVLAALSKKEVPAWVLEAIRKFWDKETLRESLNPIMQWRDTHKRPIMITEFGVYRPYVDFDSQLRWLTDVVSIFKDYNFLWTVWDYDTGFGLFEIHNAFRTLDIKMAEVLELNPVGFPSVKTREESSKIS